MGKWHFKALKHIFDLKQKKLNRIVCERVLNWSIFWMVQSLLLKKTALGKGFHLKPHFQLTIVINYRQTTKNTANAVRASLQAGCEGSWERSCLHLCWLPELCICAPGSEISPTNPKLTHQTLSLPQAQCFPSTWITWADKAVRSNNYPLVLFIQLHNLEPFSHSGGSLALPEYWAFLGAPRGHSASPWRRAAGSQWFLMSLDQVEGNLWNKRLIKF